MPNQLDFRDVEDRGRERRREFKKGNTNILKICAF